MAKEPQQPTNGGDHADERQDSWERQAFGAPGEAPPPSTEVDSGSDVSSTAAAYVHERAEELGEALHGKFMQLLSDKVRDNDGRLPPADVEEMGEEFRRELEVIETVFLDAVESFTQAQLHDRKRESRSRLFHRLIVHKFENRFADEKTLYDTPDMLSRRMLPGFFSVLSLMFGKTKLESYEQQTEQLAGKLGRTSDGDYDWASFYRTPEARQISLSAEIEIAKFFGDVEKRLDWMIAVVNTNLIPSKSPQSGAAWVFNASAAENLLKGLFGDVRPALEHPPSRQAFEKQLGPETLATLDKVVRRFS